MPTAPKPPLKLKVDDDLAKDLLHGVNETLEKFFGLRLHRTVALSQGEGFVADVFARLPMCQDHADGEMIIAFPAGTLLGIASMFHGRTFKGIERPVLDAIGEISNSVYGIVKQGLNTRGHQFRMALPEISLSMRHGLDRREGQMSFVFETDYGSFCVSVSDGR